MKLILRLVFKNWRSRPFRTLLAILGVAVGVSALLAVRLANYSSIESFARSVEMLGGNADIEITNQVNGPIPPIVYQDLISFEGFEQVSPVFIQPAVTDSRRNVTILGVDITGDYKVRSWYKFDDTTTSPLEMLTHPNGALLTPELAEELGIVKGSTLKLWVNEKNKTVTVLGLLQGDDISHAKIRDVIIMNQRQAWSLAEIKPTIHRIDIRLRDATDFDKAILSLDYFLPLNLQIDDSEWRRKTTGRLLKSFQLNLTALAFIALLASAFLVYQTVNTSAHERRKSAGLLRSLGASKKSVRQYITLEGLLLGVIGSALGVPAGIILAKYALLGVSGTVETVYLLESAQQVFISPSIIFTCFSVGVLTALIAVLPLGIEASLTPPSKTLSRQTLEEKLHSIRYFVAGMTLLIASTILARWPLAQQPVLSGYLASAGFILGAALTTPAGLSAAYRIAKRLLSAYLSPVRKLALSVIVRSRHRIAPAVAALATTFAMWIAIDMMVGSFRTTVDDWVTDTITADLIITSGTKIGVGKSNMLPFDVYEKLAKVDEFEDLDFFRSIRIEYYGTPTTLAMVNMVSIKKQNRLSYVDQIKGTHPADASIEGKNACIISEALANRLHLTIGDSLWIPTETDIEYSVVHGIHRDYTSDAGLILVDYNWFQSRWDDKRLESIAVYLPENMSIAEGNRIIRETLSDYPNLTIITNRDLRNAILRVFDNTFTITYTLEVIAILVALLAVGGGMISIINERRREIALLRALGASKRQTLQRVLTEAIWIGTIGWLLGTVLGIVLSVILSNIISKHSFGWTIYLTVPYTKIILSYLIILTASLVSGLAPAFLSTHLPLAQSIRYETE